MNGWVSKGEQARRAGWPLYPDRKLTPCVHEWHDITSVDQPDWQFMCIHCGATKFQARKIEP